MDRQPDRQQALDTLRMSLEAVANPLAREHIWQCAIAYAHAAALEAVTVLCDKLKRRCSQKNRLNPR